MLKKQPNDQIAAKEHKRQQRNNKKGDQIMNEKFENSPEYDDWIEETGGRDEDRSEYYNKWERRVRREQSRR